MFFQNLSLLDNFIIFSKKKFTFSIFHQTDNKVQSQKYFSGTLVGFLICLFYAYQNLQAKIKNKIGLAKMFVRSFLYTGMEKFEQIFCESNK